MTASLSAASLSAARRARELAGLAEGEVVDLLVVGGGITGAGVALDAASRGLSVALLERGDLASGTSRWSSKLVHGGLRYLAGGDVPIAYESAVERRILMERTAPHLVRALPMLLPLGPGQGRLATAAMTAGLVGAEVLRAAAGTSRRTLPRPRRLSRPETLSLAPALRRDGLRGGLLGWEGQLTDDARLVVAVARTAAAFGARIVPRAEVVQLAGDGAWVRDRLSGREFEVRARSVVNAAGVWAGTLSAGVALRPSRGTHLVLDGASLGLPRAGLTLPLPGERTRFAIVLPQRDGRVYAGLTDVEVDPTEPLPEVPQPTEAEVRFLLDAVSSALEKPIDTADVLGAFAGLRPLLAGAAGRTADLSRRHAVLLGGDGVITVVGGKLTTYRRMAADAVDAVVAHADLVAARCRTRRLPLVGAGAPRTLDRIPAPRRLVDRYGTEAPRLLELDQSRIDAGLTGLTVAEVEFALRHEGALTADDVLDRRTRIGLVAADREAARVAVEQIVGSVDAESGKGGGPHDALPARRP
ncbi:MAG TPA: glycerol-3-phosphate dehydrogenase/oxidase [Mycobacteriales bacterium]|jgi:glycerol-3-phosphate dehydrogenase|nr:glycerol-3-phosphate dehydrogenase/oxidase [Mycobacteriales bacterium]